MEFMKNKSSRSFKISSDTPIIIYGAAAAGIRGYHSLKTINNYNVIGFFDKRAFEIDKQCGLPVWAPETKPPLKKEDLLIVICVKNVFEHDKIAALLIDYGYKNLIFLPMQQPDPKALTDYTCIKKNYQKIFNDTDPEAQYALEPVTPLDNIELYDYRDYAVIKRAEESITVNFPLASIFIHSISSFNMLHNDALLSNVLALIPHIDLFKYFDGNGGEADAYLEFCLAGARNTEKVYGNGKGEIARTENWKKNIIQNRRIVFDAMNRDMEINFDFFIDHAPDCSLMNNLLLMKSAKHRAAFFIAKGRGYMPVAVTSKDYSAILNRSVLKELKTFLNKNKIQELDTTVQHPCMYKYPCRMPNYHALFIYKAVYHITRIFSKIKDTGKITVEDSLPDNGALSRCLSGMGLHVNRICSNDEDRALCDILDQLFYIKNIRYSDKHKGADIVCCTEMDIDKSRQLDNTRVLFVLCKGEKAPVVSGFELKRLLFRTIWCGKETAGYMLENLKLNE